MSADGRSACVDEVCADRQVAREEPRAATFSVVRPALRFQGGGTAGCIVRPTMAQHEKVTTRSRKIILSRKGFDSAAGGCASPVLPDGRLVSFPIPDDEGVPYGDLRFSA